jgi:hypothetical protein
VRGATPVAAQDGAVRASLTWDQVAAWRARRHLLDRRVPRSELLAVVRRLCGVQAQLMRSAELTLWARVDGLAGDDVSTALWQDRTLVKTWAMRGTLHLLAADEYPLWQAALSRFTHYLRAGWARGFGISADERAALLEAVPAALDGPPLTREELAAAVARIAASPGLGEKVKGSWGSLLKPSAYRGELCFAPGDGQNVRFTRPDRWLNVRPAVEPDAAAVEVARRFLAANGPAGRDDLARWWGGMSGPAAGRLVGALGDEVAEVDVDGTRAWLLAGDLDDVASAAPLRSVRLLPAFDQYVVAATRHARHLLPGPFRDRVYRPQGWLSPVVAAGGKMVGVWRHERKGSRLAVEIEPFAPLPRWARTGAEQEAARLAPFLGGALDLRPF